MISRRRFLATSATAALLPSAARAVGAPMPIFDAHLHFSHDAAERFGPHANPGRQTRSVVAYRAESALLGRVGPLLARDGEEGRAKLGTGRGQPSPFWRRRG